MKTLFSSLLLALTLSVGMALPVAHALDAQPTAATAATAPAEVGNAFLLNGLEMTSMLLACIAIFILILIIRQFGSSAISIVFGYFIIGTALLALARLFILFSNTGIFDLSGETVNLGWHLLFFLAMITFFIAGKGFEKLGNGTDISANASKVMGWGLLCGISALLIFMMAQGIDKPFTAMFAGSIADDAGVLHLIAFILGGIAAFYLFHKAKIGQVTALLAAPYLISFGLFALNHVWELFVESWKIIHVSGATGERVEQFFVLPAFLLITYAYIRLWSLVRPRA